MASWWGRLNPKVFKWVFLTGVLEISSGFMGFKSQPGILWELWGFYFLEARAASTGPQGRAGESHRTRQSLKDGPLSGL